MVAWGPHAGDAGSPPASTRDETSGPPALAPTSDTQPARAPGPTRPSKLQTLGRISQPSAASPAESSARPAVTSATISSRLSGRRSASAAIAADNDDTLPGGRQRWLGRQWGR